MGKDCSQMSPFGLVFRYLRNERGVPLKTLAAGLELSEKILSAIETGRRRPPNESQLSKIKKILRLNEEESRSLAEAARYSETRVRIPMRAKPMEYRLVHRLVEAVGGLSEQQVATIHTVLDSHGGGAFEGGKEMI